MIASTSPELSDRATSSGSDPANTKGFGLIPEALRFGRAPYRVTAAVSAVSNGLSMAATARGERADSPMASGHDEWFAAESIWKDLYPFTFPEYSLRERHRMPPRTATEIEHRAAAPEEPSERQGARSQRRTDRNHWRRFAAEGQGVLHIRWIAHHAAVQRGRHMVRPEASHVDLRRRG